MAYEADKFFNDDKDEEEKPLKHSSAMRHDDLKEIKIRFRPKTVERAIFISIILILLAYITISNTFYGCDKAISESEKSEQGVTGKSTAPETKQVEEPSEVKPTQNTTQGSAASSQNTSAPNNSSLSSPPVIQQPAPSIQSSNTPNTSQNLNATPSASLTFSSSDVENEGNKIVQISFTLKNDASSILRARVDASWYDKSDKTTMQDKICGSKSVIIPAGGTISDSITEFTRKYTNPENSAETVVLRVYDTSTDKLLDTDAVII